MTLAPAPAEPRQDGADRTLVPAGAIPRRHSDAPPGRQARRAGMLWLATAVTLASMPLAMAVAHRSSPLVISLAAAAALAATAAEGRMRTLGDDLRTVLATPLGAAALAFLGWAALSLSWSGKPAITLHAFAEFVLPIGAALVLALTLPERMPRNGTLVLASLVAAACALILIELWTGLAARRALGMRWNSFIFNRPTLTIMLVTVPLLWLMVRERRVWLALALGALVAATAMRSDSGAALLALAAGGAAFAFAHLARPLALGIAASGIVAVIGVAPAIGGLAERILPAQVHSRLAEHHSSARVEIWKSFGAASLEKPFLGAGFGVSKRLHETSLAQGVAPQYRTLLAAGHPHNAALQIWVELGAVGAGLAMLVLLLLLRSMAALPVEGLAPALALFAAVAAVSLVGHGAWQGWWPAAIGAAVVWFRFARLDGAGRLS